MKRWFSAAVLVSTVIAVGVAMLVVVGGSPAVAPAAGGVAATEDDAEPGPPDRVRGREPGPPRWAGNGEQGPPPWAAKAGKPSSGWQAKWRAMSPRDRERTMSRLAEEHAEDMRAFGRCMAEDRDDCEKPLPPGLAKKQLGR